MSRGLRGPGPAAPRICRSGGTPARPGVLPLIRRAAVFQVFNRPPPWRGGGISRTAPGTDVIHGRSGSRALSGKMEPFDRDDFAPWLRAWRCGASAKIGNDATAQKNPAFGRAHRLPGFVATLARCRASRFAPRLPGKPICRHQIDSIWPDSALEARPVVATAGRFKKPDAPVRRAGRHLPWARRR